MTVRRNEQVAVRGSVEVVVSRLPPVASLESNSGCKARQPASLPAEPFHRPLLSKRPLSVLWKCPSNALRYKEHVVCCGGGKVCAQTAAVSAEGPMVQSQQCVYLWTERSATCRDIRNLTPYVP